MSNPPPSPPHPPIEEIEEAASFAGLAIAFALRAVEVGAVVLIGLLICPPLLILSFVVVAPLLAATIVGALIAAVLAAPYLLVRRLRGHHVPHASVFARRLRHAWAAIVDLLPHRVLREARRHPLL
jgi:di/tricarboxylate transporter